MSLVSMYFLNETEACKHDAILHGISAGEKDWQEFE